MQNETTKEIIEIDKYMEMQNSEMRRVECISQKKVLDLSNTEFQRKKK